MKMKSFIHFLEEGVNDPGIFKAVFMAGGPGSGKTFMADQSGLMALGLRLINSDDVFEKALKKAGIAPTPENVFSKRAQEVIRPAAKALTLKKQEAALLGRLGLVIDGTGKKYDRINTQRKALVRMGYDTMMLFVNTDLETALQRNADRPRKLPRNEVEKMWGSVQRNIGAFQRLFGRDFVVIDNSKGKDYKKESTVAYKRASKFTKIEPQNHIAQKWIADEKKRRGITK